MCGSDTLLIEVQKEKGIEMAKKALVKVELKDLPANASFYDKERAFRTMLSIFKRQVNETGILSQWKEKQYYESPGEKRKRKRKESEVERQKERIRSHF
jgi:ribosomal protein S21